MIRSCLPLALLAVAAAPAASRAEPIETGATFNHAIEAPMPLAQPLFDYLMPAHGLGLMPGRLFPPAMVMQHQERLGLRPEQIDAIKAQMRNFQSDIVDVQWELHAASAALEQALSGDQIDSDDALARIDRVLAAENRLKRSHLRLLIDIRNQLDAGQIATLEQALPGPPGAMGAMGIGRGRAVWFKAKPAPLPEE
jgi:hypothetical protein